MRLGEINEKRTISNNVDHGLSILHLPNASERILNQKKHRSGMEQTRSVIHVVVYAAALGTVWYSRGECTVSTYGTLGPYKGLIVAPRIPCGMDLWAKMSTWSSGCGRKKNGDPPYMEQKMFTFPPSYYHTCNYFFVYLTFPTTPLQKYITSPITEKIQVTKRKPPSIVTTPSTTI